MALSSFALSRVDQADARKVDAIRAVRHEVLNALTPVVAYAKDLAKQEMDTQRREKLLAIERAGLAIERMIRSLGRGREFFKPDFKVVRVGRLLEEASQETMAFAEQRGVSLKVLGNSSTNRQVIADPDLIRRLLVNLLFNAIEASPRGKQVQLDARQVPEGIELSVTDQGPGFETGDLDVLPDGFSSKGQGRGTGLSVCKTIAMLHGSILRSKNLDPGAEVFFVLPQFSSRPERRMNPKKPRLLVVDNDPNVADSVTNLLSEKFSVDVAYDSKRALDVLRNCEVDAMVIDMDLGAVTGQDVLARMEKSGTKRPETIVFVTGDPSARDGDLIQGVRVLTKPFDSESLARMLEHKSKMLSWVAQLSPKPSPLPCAACA